MTDRMAANLDHQWQRAIMLDVHGIFVYDERGPNGWRPHVRLFPDAKRRNDVEERSTLKRRRLLLETCDRPEASAPLPRHASKQLHQRRPPTPTIIQTTGPPPPRGPGRAPTRRSPNRSPPNNRHREAGMERLERGRSRRRGRRSLANASTQARSHGATQQLDQPTGHSWGTTSNRPTR